ncbi:MAG: DUF1810 domain-containing protein [Firmicutes bacterium]|nr:DUF1810 domain-containing protein [Bacillota bacterium]
MSANLSRFIEAQERSYSIALEEIKKGRKQGHWMWYIFPQIQGLGYSSTSQYYAIQNIEEATEYLNDTVLGTRLIEICNALLKLDCNDAYSVFGSPDNLKLKSSVTLFSQVENANPVFMAVLEKFFDNKHDNLTLKKLDDLSKNANR